jgi:hypothetical protein
LSLLFHLQKTVSLNLGWPDIETVDRQNGLRRAQVALPHMDGDIALLAGEEREVVVIEEDRQNFRAVLALEQAETHEKSQPGAGVFDRNAGGGFFTSILDGHRGMDRGFRKILESNKVGIFRERGVIPLRLREIGHVRLGREPVEIAAEQFA